jgi:hypothetical protein
MMIMIITIIVVSSLKQKKYTNMRNIFLQNDKNAQVVNNPNYQKSTVAKLKKTLSSTFKSSSSY